MTGSLFEESLSAPGRFNATRMLNRRGQGDGRNGVPRPEPVLRADVQQVDAHMENDDEAAYGDLEHPESSDDEPDPTLNEMPARDPTLDAAIDDV